jgi:predicted nucleotidyltransferase
MIDDPFTPAQRQTLATLVGGLPGRRIVLIGAAALACHMEMRWRRTNDLDLTVFAEQAELESDLRKLGWIRHEQTEHRWTSKEGVLVDVLPVTAANVAEGKRAFAETGHVMSLVGFDLVLSRFVQVPLNRSVLLDVATVPVIAVLKMAAWLDRPSERQHDLEDLAHVLDDYLESDDVRRWDDDLVDARLPHEDQSAFALGKEVARVAAPSHVELVERFLAAVSDETSAANVQLARCFNAVDQHEALVGRLGAFRLGFGEGRAEAARR